MKQEENVVLTERSNMYGDKYVMDEMKNKGLRLDGNQQKIAGCLNNMILGGKNEETDPGCD